MKLKGLLDWIAFTKWIDVREKDCVFFLYLDTFLICLAPGISTCTDIFCRIALVELYDGVIMKWISSLDFMGRFHRNRRGREFPFFVDRLLLKIAINCLSSEYSGYQHEVSVRLSSCINSVPSFWILSTSEFDYCNIRQRIVII